MDLRKILEVIFVQFSDILEYIHIQTPFNIYIQYGAMIGRMLGRDIGSFFLLICLSYLMPFKVIFDDKYETRRVLGLSALHFFLHTESIMQTPGYQMASNIARNSEYKSVDFFFISL